MPDAIPVSEKATRTALALRMRVDAARGALNAYLAGLAAGVGAADGMLFDDDAGAFVAPPDPQHENKSSKQG